MKQRFLLDENVLYHAVLGVDRHNQPNWDAALVVLLIVRNCHTLVLNRFLYNRYMALQRRRPGVLEPIGVLNQLVTTQDKVVWEDDEPPELPARSDIPREDEGVVRAALISHPIVVTADEELRIAINACQALHLRAVSPAEAIAILQATQP